MEVTRTPPARVKLPLLSIQTISLPKVFGEQRINKGIDGRIAVSKPEQHGEYDGRHAVTAEGPHNVHAEEGQPAEDETTDNNAQGLGGFRLHFEPFNLKKR